MRSTNPAWATATKYAPPWGSNGKEISLFLEQPLYDARDVRARPHRNAPIQLFLG